MWTQQSLSALVREKLGDYLLVVASNREPYIHAYDGDAIKVSIPASGLTIALDPVMRACGGTWVAHGSGDADKAVSDTEGRVMVPPGDGRYSLKRIWLSPEEVEGFYYGFANQALWPLCHIAYTRPVFSELEWNTYKKVNETFARSVLEEVGDKKAFVFIQDYHLALLPRLIKERNPNIIVAQFWHIPWPNPEAFRICPWQEEILHGLLGNDLLGFHIRYHCNNFMDNVNREIEAKVDWERSEVTRGGKGTFVQPFPISIDFEAVDREARKPEVAKEIERLKDQLGLEGEKVGIGLDRLDYTKGIPDRLQAIDRLLDKEPRYRERLVFIQAGVPSRVHIGSYQALSGQVDDLVEAINRKYQKGRWRPLVYMHQLLSPLTLMALRRLADFCVVSSLHDGMNLVAKEYVASRYDEDGVLILSRFTGAARELDDALLVNPYATDHFADTIRDALEMPPADRQRRMVKMRQQVSENNVYKWAAAIITELVKFEFGR